MFSKKAMISALPSNTFSNASVVNFLENPSENHTPLTFLLDKTTKDMAKYLIRYGKPWSLQDLANEDPSLQELTSMFENLDLYEQKVWNGKRKNICRYRSSKNLGNNMLLVAIASWISQTVSSLGFTYFLTRTRCLIHGIMWNFSKALSSKLVYMKSKFI